MLLMDAIHARWEADAPLKAALDTTRLMTIENIGGSESTTPGIAEETPGTISLPYCEVSIDSGGPTLDTNAGTVDLVDVTFQLFHEDYNTGRTIANHIKRVFNRQKFAVAAGANQETVINMKRRGGAYLESRQLDAFWFVIGFDVLDHLVAGY